MKESWLFYGFFLSSMRWLLITFFISISKAQIWWHQCKIFLGSKRDRTGTRLVLFRETWVFSSDGISSPPPDIFQLWLESSVCGVLKYGQNETIAFVPSLVSVWFNQKTFLKFLCPLWRKRLYLYNKGVLVFVPFVTNTTMWKGSWQYEGELCSGVHPVDICAQAHLLQPLKTHTIVKEDRVTKEGVGR